MVGFDNLQSFCKGYKKKQHNMNTKNKILAGLFSMAALFSSCNDFQEINEDPNQVDESKVKPEWFLNASIVGDQMYPDLEPGVSFQPGKRFYDWYG